MLSRSTGTNPAAFGGRFAVAGFLGVFVCVAAFAAVFRGRGLDFVSSIAISLAVLGTERAALARASLRIPGKL
jgi:hypothetical protein